MIFQFTHLVFRVTGLPASQPDDELNGALKAAIYNSLVEGERSKVTVNAAIVPSCYDNDENGALVEFYGGVTAFLITLNFDDPPPNDPVLLILYPNDLSLDDP